MIRGRFCIPRHKYSIVIYKRLNNETRTFTRSTRLCMPKRNGKRKMSNYRELGQKKRDKEDDDRISLEVGIRE